MQTLTDNIPARINLLAGRIDGLRAALNQALRGKADVVEKVLACLLARGHLLLEDLPGLGKTTLAKAVAAAVGGRFSRVQCTPDLLPGIRPRKSWSATSPLAAARRLWCSR